MNYKTTTLLLGFFMIISFSRLFSQQKTIIKLKTDTNKPVEFFLFLSDTTFTASNEATTDVYQEDSKNKYLLQISAITLRSNKQGILEVAPEQAHKFVNYHARVRFKEGLAYKLYEIPNALIGINTFGELVNRNLTFTLKRK